MSNGENKGADSFVPQRDERIARRSPPPVKAKSSGVKDKPPAKGSPVWKLLLLLTLAFAAALAWYAWQQSSKLQATSSQLDTLQTQFDSLSSRISSTDESLSQSGAAIQLKLKEIDAEIAKLWGVSYDKNRKAIAENKVLATKASNIAAKMEKTMASLEKKIKALQTSVEKDSKTLANVSATTLSLSAELEEIKDRLRKVSDQSSRLDKTLNKLNTDITRRVAANEEAVEAIDAHRRRMNQELLEIRQSLGQK